MFENVVRDGININTSDNLGNFLIHVAARIGDDSILNHLLRNNASVNAKNQDGQTALHLAAQNGHTDVFDTLQEHDLIDSVDRNNKTYHALKTNFSYYKVPIKKLFLNFYFLYMSVRMVNFISPWLF